MTSVLAADCPGWAERAGDALSEGSVIAIPTDTVYGLAAALGRPEAIARLFALKGRPPDVPCAVLVAGPDQAASITTPLTALASRLAERFWPGPLTLVVERRSGFDVDLGGPPEAQRTVGVRWPADRVVEELALRSGPLVATSANLHGEPPARAAAEVCAAFEGDERLALVLDGGVRRGTPSTVVDCTGETLRCLRDGAVAWAELVEYVQPGPTVGGSGDR
jgi:tRNA threonylcarbamoyl adenosine modification protein (Sua5/YciO/YrdC/YwlC family)